MSSKTLLKAQWLWQDYTGAKWQNLEWANTGDDKASYVYPQGKGSKSSYRPKSLFYHYQVTGIDDNKYKLDSVTFVLVIGKFNTSSNTLPTIKVFSGDNNAPYKKSPIATISAYKSLKNKYDFDSHTMEFTLKNVTIAQLQNIIIEVDWGKTKISGSSTISVNRARLKVDYSLKDPKWDIYDYIVEEAFWDYETPNWKITAKNKGYNGKGEVDIVLPKGVEITSSTGDGSYNNSTKKWTFSADAGKTQSRYFKLKFTSVGTKKLVAKNIKYPTNAKLTRELSILKSTPKPSPKGYDTIKYTFYDVVAKEKRQYFDVQINGGVRNHPDGIACYTISATPNITLYTPLVYPNVYILSESDDRVYTQEGSYDNKICLNVEPNEEFEAHLRIFFECDDTLDSGTVTMVSVADGRQYDYTFQISPPKINRFTFEYEPSRDMHYVQSSINIGSPEVWSFRTKNSRHNFFKEKATDFSINIEPQVPYIGCVPLSRGHKWDAKSDVTNDEIDTTYLNRRYLGKQGNTKEKITMTLRMPWSDIATLQGLVAMDKPIPIDTCPDLLDGDPINHRGWAEITGVKNVHKINDMLYECEPDVDYLTHKLLTKFAIEQRKELTDTQIDFVLSETHHFGDDLLERFNLNYYQFWTNLEDDDGNIAGSYNLQSNNNLLLNSNEKMSEYSNYDIKFRNTLPSLMSDDYNNNWEMAVRIRDKVNRTILFEHLYNNFKHYDYDNMQVLNVADTTTKLWNGTNYDILSFEKIALGYGDLSVLLEDRKNITHFNSIDDTIFDVDNNKFEIFLLDIDDNGLANEKVIVKVYNDEYMNKFSVITDIFGRIIFPVNFGNGQYTIELIYEETETNRGCHYSRKITVNYEEVELHFEYPTDIIVTKVDTPYTFKVLDSNDNPVNNIMVHYSFRDIGMEGYGYERTATSNSNGLITIPIDWTNGTKMLKVNMKGFEHNGTVYQPVSFEQEVDINILGKDITIEADNMNMTQGENVKNYYVKVMDEKSNPLSRELTFGIYNKNESYVYTATSNEYGVASIPLYLSGDAWFVDVHYRGSSEEKPNVVTSLVDIRKFEQLQTTIKSENLHLNENLIIEGGQDYYTLILTDSLKEPIVAEPVSVEITSTEGVVYADMVLKTNDEGKIKVPYIGHNENVIINTEYYGCTRYKPASHSDVVAFDNIDPKIPVDFRASPNGVQLQIQYGNGAWDTISNSSDMVRVVINYEDNTRSSEEGINYYQSMNGGVIYKCTLHFKGNEQYYAYTKTVTFDKTNDSRKTLWQWIEMFVDVPDETITFSNNVKGDLNHIEMVCNYELPFMPVYLGVELGEYSGTYDEVVKTMPTYRLDESGNINTVIEYNIVNPVGQDTQCFYGFFIKTNNHIGNPMDESADILMVSRVVDVVGSDKETVNLSQNGFGYLSQTYQNINISATNPNAQSHDKVNEFYIMKLLNNDTLEQFYFFSYLVDNVTVSNIEFLLGKGNWELYMVSKDTENYQGGRYTASAILTEDSKYVHTFEYFYEIDNYNQYQFPDQGEFELVIDGGTIWVDNGTWGGYAITNEFTKANKWELRFEGIIHRFGKTIFDGNGFVLGSNPNAGLERDGVWIEKDVLTHYKDGTIINQVYGMFREFQNGADFKVIRNGDKWFIYLDDILKYSTELEWNTLGLYSDPENPQIRNVQLAVEPISQITPAVEDWDGTIFGSDVFIRLRKNVLDFIDYGMLSEGETGAGKVILNNIVLPTADYELETEIRYNNSRFERLHELEGLIQMRIYEDILLNESSTNYSKIICSPVPLKNSITMFTRLTDEGRMYYSIPSNTGAEYLCNPYIQYKGGCDLKSENNISLFSLDNGFSPVYLSNGLVRAEFHRYSGYVKVSRYDENTQDWYTCQIFHIGDEPNLELMENYSDDKATIRFGNTKWSIWRGRPFIRLEHPDDDLRMLNIYDRVFCEIMENELAMGFVEETDVTFGVFTPQMSIQKFKEEYHIGQDIHLDNFRLTALDGENNEYDDVEIDADIYTVVIDNENAIKMDMNSDNRIGLVFPSNDYVEKPASTFSLLIEYLVQNGMTGLTVKARGYTENGRIKEKDELQYGIWEDIQEVILMDDDEPDEIRLTFTNVPDEVRFIDFVLMFTSAGGTVTFNKLMLYDGDSTSGYDIDRSNENADTTELNFTETYYACLYDEKAPCGLGIFRPNRKGFSLRRLTKAEETLLIPYMKSYSEWDAVEKIFVEYLNSKDQVINVKWKG